ncbi:MAG: GH5, partial [uncultured Solirubrobacteraceae bacterium]
MKPILALACALLLLCAPAAQAAVDQEATFQDDNLLVYGTPDKVAEAMDELKRLGVDRLRISVFWAVVAPKDRPADPSDPAQYPNGSWDRYDTIVRLARERDLGVNFNITTPAPSWATGNPEREDIKETYEPDADEWGRFVKAVATRYDGAHGPGRVDYWSLMNEPNQPGWLTPQWRQRGGDWVEAAPQTYRDMVRTGWQALQDTGHGSDTILVGELAPKGRKETKGLTIATDPLRFIRRLYCLDDNLQVLDGKAAEQQGCPTRDQIAAFPVQNPGLFQMTGWSHHPYELLFAPDRRQSWPDWVTTANLDDLQSVLGRIRARYGQSDL